MRNAETGCEGVPAQPGLGGPEAWQAPQCASWGHQWSSCARQMVQHACPPSEGWGLRNRRVPLLPRPAAPRRQPARPQDTLPMRPAGSRTNRKKHHRTPKGAGIHKLDDTARRSRAV